MPNNEADQQANDRIQLNQEIHFTTLTGVDIAAKAKQLSLTLKGVKHEYALLIEVEWSAYQLILKEEAFGLYSHTIGLDAEMAFEETEPVELRAILRQSLTAVLIAQGEELENVWHYLLQKELPKEMPVRSAESWLAAEVKQKVTLPGELIEKGTLKKGYRTAWMDALVTKPKTVEKSLLIEVVEQFLTAAEWGFERLDETLLRLAVQGEQGDWVILVQTDEEDQRCIVYSVYPELVPESRREAVAAILIQENYEIPIGNFEMDLTDGEVRFRTSIEVVEGRMTMEWFERMFTVNISMTDGYFALISEEIK
jgi:hypothetical protein